jgi:ribosomal protein S18 acetylase RimI-like enzyme
VPPESDPPADDVVLRPAQESDVEAVTALVLAAYRPWVPRLGTTPGPMQADYREVLAAHDVTVAEEGGRLVGLVVTEVTGDECCIENVAVHPGDQGRGLGGRLLAHAEGHAREASCGSVHLFTHARMSENLALYRRRGYAEYRRDTRDGAPLVFLRKPLG